MFVQPQTMIWQYTHGVPDTTRVSEFLTRRVSPQHAVQASPKG